MKTNQRTFLPATLALSLLILSGCASGTLPDYNILGGLRILALKADQPEVDPTTSPTVNITPVVSDLNVGGSLSYSAVGCIDPGVGSGVQPSCTGVPGAATLASGAFAITDPLTAKLVFTGTAPSVAVPIPPTLLATATPANAFNGVAYLLLYTLTSANPDGSTSQVVSFKRIIGSTKTPKNTNPSITGLYANATGSQTLQAFLSTLTFPPPGGATAAMTPAFGPTSVENYTLEDSSGNQSQQTESLTTTWFVSDGATAFERTNLKDSNTWTPPATTPAIPGGGVRGVVIVAVTRDGRGGEDFFQVEF